MVDVRPGGGKLQNETRAPVVPQIKKCLLKKTMKVC